MTLVHTREIAEPFKFSLLVEVGAVVQFNRQKLLVLLKISVGPKREQAELTVGK